MLLLVLSNQGSSFTYLNCSINVWLYVCHSVPSFVSPFVGLSTGIPLRPYAPVFFCLSVRTYVRWYLRLSLCHFVFDFSVVRM